MPVPGHANTGGSTKDGTSAITSMPGRHPSGAGRPAVSATRRIGNHPHPPLHCVPVTRFDVRSVVHFIRCVAYQRALNEATSIDWKQEDNLAVKILSLGAAGIADVDLGTEQQRNALCNAWTTRMIDGFLEALCRGSAAANAYLCDLQRQKDESHRALQDKFQQANAINVHQERSAGRAIVTLATVKLLCDVVVIVCPPLLEGAAAGEIFMVSASGKAISRAATVTNIMYTVAGSEIKEHSKDPDDTSSHVLLTDTQKEGVEKTAELGSEFGAKQLEKAIEYLEERASDLSKDFDEAINNSLNASKWLLKHPNASKAKISHKLSIAQSNLDKATNADRLLVENESKFLMKWQKSITLVAKNLKWGFAAYDLYHSITDWYELVHEQHSE